MEGKKSIVTVALMILPLLLIASEKTKVYHAYIHNRMEEWKSVIDEMHSRNSSDTISLAELLNYQYGYIGFCLAMEKEKEARGYLDLAEENLEFLEEIGYRRSIIHAYKSAFYGFKIGLSPIKATFLGPKSMKQAELAIEADPYEPMGYIQQGNAQFYMPPVFGGSKTEAIEKFKLAMDLMTKEGQSIKNDWNYLSLLVLIAQSYEEMEKWEQAKKYYNQALAVEPEFKWVKNELLPGLLKKEEKDE